MLSTRPCQAARKISRSWGYALLPHKEDSRLQMGASRFNHDLEDDEYS